MSVSTRSLKFPKVTRCPSCGGKRFRRTPSRWYSKDGSLEFRECADCTCHFAVSGYREFRVPAEPVLIRPKKK